jgi:hypothetical protein
MIRFHSYIVGKMIAAMDREIEVIEQSWARNVFPLQREGERRQVKGSRRTPRR